MRILLLSAYFSPDVGSAAHLFYELGTALARRGHDVTVITSLPGYHVQGPLDRYRGKLWLQEEVDGIKVVRTATPRLPRRLMLGRALWQFGSAAAFSVAGLRVPPQDAAIVYSPPLPLGLTAWLLYRLRGIAFILNVQDLFPRSIIDLGLLRNRWLIRFFELMERFVYRRAPLVTVHSPGNRNHVIAHGGSPERTVVLPNWVDIDFIRPGDRINGFRCEHGLGDRFIASFAGVMGYSQDLDVVLEAAHRLTGHPDVLFLVVGDGVEKPRLEQKARKMGLTNVRFLPMQPRDRYPAVLQASDVCLTTLRASVKTPVVPSKILSIMAAGRPVIAALHPEGDAPKLIASAGCGFSVPPEDPQALAEAVLTLYQSPELREQLGCRGRQYAEAHFSLEHCATLYETLFAQVINSHQE